jgi:anti-anti-sigma factor
MEISVSETGSEKVVTIEVDERLDCSVHSAFNSACKLVEAAESRKIVIDLSKTRRIADSGLAMLMMLRNRLGRVKNRILLVNCRPELRKSLAVIQFPTKFRIAQRAS